MYTCVTHAHSILYLRKNFKLLLEKGSLLLVLFTTAAVALLRRGAFLFKNDNMFDQASDTYAKETKAPYICIILSEFQQ